jgi:hypothetical protein
MQQSTPAKHNDPSPNAVYTANDCFSDGLDNMEFGKCYSLNPDRGTQYGWINNNAQDKWWWREVACGGGSSNGCSGNSFLSKKSMLEKDSDDSNEDISYKIWGKSTQFFYDALGRKTQAHPETRRYLFAPKKKELNYEKEYWQFGTISFVLKTIIGEVDAKHKYIANAYSVKKTGPCNCPEDVAWTDLRMYFSLTTTTTTNLNGNNNPLLIAHEKKHEEIYKALGNGTWEKTVQVNYCGETYESVCNRFKQEVRAEFEKKLRILVDAQNKWDDDDINNISHERISLQEKLDEMYGQIHNSECPQVQ